MSLCHATNAVGSDILGVPSSTTTPNRIHLSAQPHHLIFCIILLGLAGNDLFQQTWQVIHGTRTCDLASAFRQGCQITNFTKCKINSRNLGSTLLHKYGLVVLHQDVINFQQWHFGVKDSKHQPLSSSNGSVLLWPSWKYEGPYSYEPAFCCRNVGPNGPNNKHSLEEHLWHVASTTSTVASLQVARLGWLPSKTTTALWLASNLTDVPVAMKCQINNQLKPDIPQHKPGSPWALGKRKTGRYLQLRSFTFSARHDLYSRPLLDPVSWWLSQSCDS